MKEKLRNTLLNEGFDCYLFYTPSKFMETTLSRKLNNRYPNACFLTLRKMMHRSKDGKKWDEQVLLLENYIFVYVRKDEPIDFLKEITSMSYVQDIGNGNLEKDNLAYARWILEMDGLLEISTARLENNMVQITSGPLHELKDKILKYSKRNRNCFVSFNIGEIKIETWLPFVWDTDKE